ncbi:MAG: sedoheptulokinase [Christensenellales bacterium]|jgi:sugar (pentulose or hexulose) kinase
MKIIAIDIGSSFLKASLLDLDSSKVVEQRKAPSPSRLPSKDPDIFEVPAMKYVDIVRALAKEWTAKYNDISLLLLSTQMHGFVYSYSKDEKDDLYTSWQDMRCLRNTGGEKTYLELMEEMFPPKSMEKCGVYIKPSMGMCNLYTMLSGGVPHGGTLYTIGSYVISKLTGNNICHASNAAPLGLMDVKSGIWAEDIIKKAGLRDITLPKLAGNDFEPCGYFKAAGKDIAVFPDYGDHQVATVGCMPTAGEGLINIATGAQVAMIAEKFELGAYELRPYFERRYLKTISNMPAGRGLDVLINFASGIIKSVTGTDVALDNIWNAVKREYKPDTGGIIVNTSFYAAPNRMDGGSIGGIRQSNLTLSSLFAAAFEDMAEAYKQNLEVIGGENKLSSLVCFGGVSWKLPELLAVIKKTTDLKCRLPDIEDEALAGLFRIGLRCAGLIKSLDDRLDLRLSINAEGN